MNRNTKTTFGRVQLGLMVVVGVVVVLATGAHPAGSFCLVDADCDDGLFCTGAEACDPGTHQCTVVSPCPPSIPPTVCDEVNDSCEIYCTSDLDCDDGLFCNGTETCDLFNNRCVAVSACPPSVHPTVCNEVTDTCDRVPIFDDDFDSGGTSFWSSTVP